MTRAPCSMPGLVEARRDGRLDRAEAASVERHIRSCADCARHEAQLARLEELAREGAPSSLDAMARRRRRLALLRDAAAEPTTTLRPAGRWRPIMVAAVAMLALAIVGKTLLTSPLGRLEWSPASPQSGQAFTAAEVIDAKVTALISTNFERHTLYERGVTTEQVRLYEGSVDVHVHALSRAQRFVVATGDAEVEVRGTKFTVVAVDDRLVRVAVREGRVEVRHGHMVRMLLPGQTWTRPETTADTHLASPNHRVASKDQRDPAPPNPGSMPQRVTPAASVTPAATAPPGTSATPAASAVDLPPPTDSEASKAFARAMSLLEGRRYDEADGALREFARNHPTDPRAEDADYLVIVALQRAGRHAAAAQAAQRYLARYPRGARRSWARAIANRTQLSP